MQPLFAEASNIIYMNPLIPRTKKAVYVGWFFSSCYSLYVTALYLFQGPDFLKDYNSSLLELIISYFIAGTVAGMTIGVLQPLTKKTTGAILVYSIASFFIVVCFSLLMYGSLLHWDSDMWISNIFLGFVFGGAGTIIAKRLGAMDTDTFGNSP